MHSNMPEPWFLDDLKNEYCDEIVAIVFELTVYIINVQNNVC